jgi:hypothetical protein
MLGEYFTPDRRPGDPGYAIPGRMSRTLTGPKIMRGGEAIRRMDEAKNQWPYNWIMAPRNSIRQDPMSYIASPAVGAANQATILTFSVPSGYMFVMTQLLIGAFTTGMVGTGNPGDFQCSVDKNTPLGGGALQGSPLADWSNIPFNQGSLLWGPLQLPRPEIFDPEDVIRAKVINNSLGVGAPNFFCAQFGGWLLPAEV